MNTLDTTPLSLLLGRIFAASSASLPSDDPALADLVADHENLMRSKTGYQAFYDRLKDYPLAVSPETGRLLYLLARSSGARSIVEFGTSFGVSTLHLAAALRDNGGGRLITTEFEPSKAKRAHENLVEAGLDDLVEIREGDALVTLASGLPPSIDLLLLDGAKALYTDVLALVESRLRPGALIVADDAGYDPVFLRKVRSPGSGYLSMPFRDDVELAIRTR